MSFKALFALLFSLLVAAGAHADSYQVDDVVVQAMFSNAVEINYAEAASEILEDVSGEQFMELRGIKEKDRYLAAFFAGCFGYIGVHRWYLGTSVGTAIAYCFLGGCLFYVDFWIIMVDCIFHKNGTLAYEGNRKLFMWK